MSDGELGGEQGESKWGGQAAAHMRLHSSIARSMPRPSFCTMQYILQFEHESGEQRCAVCGMGVVAHMISWAMAVLT